MGQLNSNLWEKKISKMYQLKGISEFRIHNRILSMAKCTLHNMLCEVYIDLYPYVLYRPNNFSGLLFRPLAVYGSFSTNR